jgi:type IX secretion system PorP/SprF family membrane protein
MSRACLIPSIRSFWGVIAPLIVCLIIGLDVRLVNGQQLPQYSQYVLNNYLLNPAVTGIENYTDLKLGNRGQWSGLEGAPTTSYLTLHTPLGTQFLDGDATAGPVDYSNPLSRNSAREYRAAAPHHGIGLMIVSDKAGVDQPTALSATYAYHIGISPRFNLSAGLSAGAGRISLNTASARVEDPADIALSDGSTPVRKPELGIGLWGYSASYYFGMSALQLLPQYSSTKASGTANLLKNTVPHFFVTGGIKLFLSDDLSLIPSVLFKYARPLPVSFDINLKLAFNSLFWWAAPIVKTIRLPVWRACT